MPPVRTLHSSVAEAGAPGLAEALGLLVARGRAWRLAFPSRPDRWTVAGGCAEPPWLMAHPAPPSPPPVTTASPRSTRRRVTPGPALLGPDSSS